MICKLVHIVIVYYLLLWIRKQLEVFNVSPICSHIRYTRVLYDINNIYPNEHKVRCKARCAINNNCWYDFNFELWCIYSKFSEIVTDQRELPYSVYNNNNNV